MTFKILGQAAPDATTETTVYQVAEWQSAVLSTISVCNRGAIAATYRLALVPGGETLADKHYVAYDAVLPAYSSDYHRGGFTLASSGTVQVYCSTADFSISVFGDES